MEEAEFLIPHGIDELLEFVENQYSVQDVLEPVEIREQYTGKILKKIQIRIFIFFFIRFTSYFEWRPRRLYFRKIRSSL